MLCKNYLPALVLLLISIFIVGCSEQDDPVAQIQKSGEITFAMSGGFPPFNYYDENSILKGFDLDVANEIARRLEVNFIPITVPWESLIPQLEAGAYDGILASMAITEERLEKINFSIPYYYSQSQVLVKKNTPYETVKDIHDRTIGVVADTTYVKDAQSLFPRHIRYYESDIQAILELNHGVVDAVVTDYIVCRTSIHSGKYNVRMLDKPIRQEAIAIGFRKQDAALLKAVNDILKNMHEDGTLIRLSHQWLGIDVTRR